ncbi:MAG: GNAT family N-acetyltransferase [Candidatus Binataceae bacterium]
MIHKKVHRRRAPDEIGVEQAHDLAQVTAILDALGMSTEGLTWAPACYLLAYIGDVPIGTAGIEPRVDAAMLRSVGVIELMRRRGTGSRLVEAARVAAHTRGARTLYTLAPPPLASWFERLGFAPVAQDALMRALAGTFLADRLKARSDALNGLIGLAVDIANDGVIER